MTDNHAKTPTSGGVPITDDQIGHLATEAKQGYDTDILRRRGDRRPMGSAAANTAEPAAG